jgi:hypothetical protein
MSLAQTTVNRPLVVCHLLRRTEVDVVEAVEMDNRHLALALRARSHPSRSKTNQTSPWSTIAQVLSGGLDNQTGEGAWPVEEAMQPEEAVVAVAVDSTQLVVEALVAAEASVVDVAAGETGRRFAT